MRFLTYGVDWYHHLPPHVKGILSTLQKAGFEAYLVGGSVRDLWLGLEPKDFDLASSATPDEIEQLFPRTEGVGRQFGIMIVVTEGGAVEVARFRADAEYMDGRHPTGVTFSSSAEDAKRRDFTLNGLFYDPAKNEVIDYVGGVSDIEARIIRCVGDPALRFQEDSLRMLRAVRFHSQLASRGFSLDPDLIAAVRAQSARLSLVSRERVTQEMSKVFLSPQPSLGLNDLLQTNLWSPVFGPTPVSGAALDKFDLLAPVYEKTFGRDPGLPLFIAAAGRWILGWEAEQSFVLARDAKAALKEVPIISSKLQAYASLPLAEKKSLLASTFFPEAWTILSAEGQSSLLQAEQDWKDWSSSGKLDPAPLLRGADILTLGIAPGPQVKAILDQVRTAQLNEELASKEAALAWITARLPGK